MVPSRNSTFLVPRLRGSLASTPVVIALAFGFPTLIHPSSMAWLSRRKINASVDAPVAGTILTQADEINAHGQIVGVYIGADDVSHAFLVVGATFTSFDFPGATQTSAYGINSAGQVVGKYSDPNGSTHGF